MATSQGVGSETGLKKPSGNIVVGRFLFIFIELCRTGDILFVYLINPDLLSIVHCP